MNGALGAGAGDASGNGYGNGNGNDKGTGVGTGTGTGTGMTAAEKEMEVIRKRRDMLIARAAQVQASSQPSAVHQSQLPANWNHGELYQNGGGLYSTGTANNHGTNPITNGLALFATASNPNPMFSTEPQSLNSSRRSTLTLDNFDTSLARFSLDPTKIGQNGYINGGTGEGGVGTGGKAKVGTGAGAAPDGGRCHGCGASVTPEWRQGPDGPRSLCNACGVSLSPSPSPSSFLLIPIPRLVLCPTSSSSSHHTVEAEGREIGIVTARTECEVGALTK